jgi:hypothetical protein
MKRCLLASLLVLIAKGWGLAGTGVGGGSIVLTGLLDIGPARAACLKVDGNSLVLHPGETASGLVLRELNAKAGWAVVFDGASEIKVWVSNAIVGSVDAAAPVQTGRSYARQSEPGSPSESAAPEVSDLGGVRSGSSEGAARFSVPPGGYTNPWLEAYLGMDKKRAPAVPAQPPAPRPEDPNRPPVSPPPDANRSPASQPEDVNRPPSSRPEDPNRQPISSPADANRPPSSPPEDVPSAPPAAQPAQSTPTEQFVAENAPAPVSNSAPVVEVGAGHRPILPPENALDKEGEMIRGFYGMEAFLAWDLAHRDRNQNPKQ